MTKTYLKFTSHIIGIRIRASFVKLPHFKFVSSPTDFVRITLILNALLAHCAASGLGDVSSCTFFTIGFFSIKPKTLQHITASLIKLILKHKNIFTLDLYLAANRSMKSLQLTFACNNGYKKLIHLTSVCDNWFHYYGFQH